MRKRLIIVDDEPDILNLCSTIIERSFDLDIITASSVRLAQQIMNEQTIDLAIFDLRLPDGTGFELVQHLFELNPSATVLMITAHGQCKEKQKAAELGVSKVLSKPFASGELLNELRHMLNGYVNG